MANLYAEKNYSIGVGSGKKIFYGTAVSDGKDIGRITVLPGEPSESLEDTRVEGMEVPEELGRLRQAFQLMLIVIDYSENLLQAGGTDSYIFTLEKALLEDEEVRKKMFSMIENEKCRAETAVRIVLEDYQRGLASGKGGYFRERSSDILDLRMGLMDALNRPDSLLTNMRADRAGVPAIGNGIVLAKELTPRLVIEQRMGKAGGIITEQGGANSHAAILCRALKIPAVTGIEGACGRIGEGETVLLDGTSGMVIVSPDEKDRAAVYPGRGNPPGYIAAAGKPRSTNGLTVMMNVNFSEDAIVTQEMPGVGLYRTEFEFMAARKLLDEDEQEVRYSRVVRRMRGAPVHIRMLDIARDKNFTAFEDILHQKLVPGSYGTQFYFDHPEIFRTQARAIARASAYGTVGVIYPMVADADQFDQLKRMFLQAVPDIPAHGLWHGAMLELPSACLQAREILSSADFANIGTNDLVKYLFGLDRNADSAFARRARLHPVLWDLLARVASAARESGRPLIACGEMAGDPECVERFLDIGVHKISLAPGAVL